MHVVHLYHLSLTAACRRTFSSIVSFYTSVAVRRSLQLARVSKSVLQLIHTRKNDTAEWRRRSWITQKLPTRLHRPRASIYSRRFVSFEWITTDYSFSIVYWLVHTYCYRRLPADRVFACTYIEQVSSVVYRGVKFSIADLSTAGRYFQIEAVVNAIAFTDEYRYQSFGFYPL